jgi:uncharacterized protein (DUF2062 family)
MAISRFARQGLSPERLAMCIALGVVLSIFPVLGATTLMCAVTATVFRLNLPLMQMVNFAAYPLQIILLIPFYSAASYLSDGHLPIEAVSQVIASLEGDVWEGVLRLWHLTLYAVFVWLLVSPMFVLILYRLLLPVVTKIQSVFQPEPSTRKLSKSHT